MLVQNFKEFSVIDKQGTYDVQYQYNGFNDNELEMCSILKLSFKVDFLRYGLNMYIRFCQH